MFYRKKVGICGSRKWVIERDNEEQSGRQAEDTNHSKCVCVCIYLHLLGLAFISINICKWMGAIPFLHTARIIKQWLCVCVCVVIVYRIKKSIDLTNLYARTINTHKDVHIVSIPFRKTKAYAQEHQHAPIQNSAFWWALTQTFTDTTMFYQFCRK